MTHTGLPVVVNIGAIQLAITAVSLFARP